MRDREERRPRGKVSEEGENENEEKSSKENGKTKDGNRGIR